MRGLAWAKTAIKESRGILGKPGPVLKKTAKNETNKAKRMQKETAPEK